MFMLSLCSGPKTVELEGSSGLHREREQTDHNYDSQKSIRGIRQAVKTTTLCLNSTVVSPHFSAAPSILPNAAKANEYETETETPPTSASLQKASHWFMHA